jgi:Leucine-rich repeat (LRR) protein
MPLAHILLAALGIGGTIPSEIGDLPHLNVLQMPFNEFTGTIPQSLVNEKMLRLELHDNFLAGDISSFFLGFDQLQVLSLNKNMFSGSIPSAIGALTNLKGLFLSYNILSGSIPSQISLCKNLIFANLDWNQFIGQIPTETGLLTQLHELWARRNLFSGTLPSEIGNMFKLGEFLMHFLFMWKISSSIL